MKPVWLKKRLSEPGVMAMKDNLRHLKLHSVCEEARCPNLSECFSKKIATIMIMGDICTRACKFCAVKTGRPLALDPKEPQNVAEWVKEMGLRHVVITSVDRDDLPDLGANHFAETIKVVGAFNPHTKIEVLTPDFQGRAELIKIVCEASPLVFNHNLETVRRLTPQVRSAAKYETSLFVIKWVKDNFPSMITKSGLMLGLGETVDETIEAMKDLRSAGCDMLTLGQYLQPTSKHLPVIDYIQPSVFDSLKDRGTKMGFRAIFSGPFVRSSYMAEHIFEESFFGDFSV